ncbi:MAG: trehalose-phosphatase [Acidobacteria bacterium]|nr:trehalose-phosphatase [Acidobacteriota bacterium]
MQNGESVEHSQRCTKINSFLSTLSTARSRALLLDYDGTLAPFACDRARAFPYPEVPETLHRIQSDTDTRLVIVTGRRASDIPRLLGLVDIEIWGCHGLERLRPDGSNEIARVDARLLAAVETACNLVACEGLSHLAERKTAGIAVHWRGREQISEHVVQRMRRIWSMIPDRSDLRFAPFDGGIEIRAAVKDKGDAVRSIFSEMGPQAAIAYLGDDITDEDAFGALTRRGLNILVRTAYRPTLADAWIKPPAELLAFLQSWISACPPPSQQKPTIHCGSKFSHQP